MTGISAVGSAAAGCWAACPRKLKSPSKSELCGFFLLIFRDPGGATAVAGGLQRTRENKQFEARRLSFRDLRSECFRLGQKKEEPGNRTPLQVRWKTESIY
jgi:hypothetical protein